MTAPDMAIKDLRLPPRTATALASCNIGTVPELAKLTAADLRQIKGIGDGGLNAIREALLRRGLRIPDCHIESRVPVPLDTAKRLCRQVRALRQRLPALLWADPLSVEEDACNDLIQDLSDFLFQTHRILQPWDMYSYSYSRFIDSAEADETLILDKPEAGGEEA